MIAPVQAGALNVSGIFILQLSGNSSTSAVAHRSRRKGVSKDVWKAVVNQLSSILCDYGGRRLGVFEVLRQLTLRLHGEENIRCSSTDGQSARRGVMLPSTDYRVTAGNVSDIQPGDDGRQERSWRRRRCCVQGVVLGSSGHQWTTSSHYCPIPVCGRALRPAEHISLYYIMIIKFRCGSAEDCGLLPEVVVTPMLFLDLIKTPDFDSKHTHTHGSSVFRYEAAFIQDSCSLTDDA